MTGPIRKAVFPVAGLGTRFLPATKAMPKEMLTVVDKPLIQYAVEEARDAGIEQFIFVTSWGKAAVEDHFDTNLALEQTLAERGKDVALRLVAATTLSPGQVSSVRQPEPLGLGHAVWCARHLVGDEPFAVLLPDDMILAETPCLRQMTEAYAQAGGNMAAVMEVPRDQTARYGVLDVVEDDGTLARARGLVEKPKPAAAPSTLSIIGRYILQPGIFAVLDRKERGTGNEIQLTDAISRMIPETPFHGLRFKGTRFDSGTRAGFLEANVAFALSHPELGGDMAEILERYAALAVRPRAAGR